MDLLLRLVDLLPGVVSVLVGFEELVLRGCDRLKIVDVAHHLDAVLIEADPLQPLGLELAIHELLDLGGRALSVLTSRLLLLLLVAVLAVFPQYLDGHFQQLLHGALDYLYRAAVLVKREILRLVVLSFDVLNCAASPDGGCRLYPEVERQISVFELSLHRYALLERSSLLEHPPSEVTLVEALHFHHLVLADAYEISTDFPDEAHQDPFAACAHSEYILMSLFVLVQLEIGGIACVCLDDPQIISVEIRKLSDYLEAGDFFGERASIKGGEDEHKHTSIVIHDFHSDSEVLLASVLLIIHQFMLLQFFNRSQKGSSFLLKEDIELLHLPEGLQEAVNEQIVDGCLHLLLGADFLFDNRAVLLEKQGGFLLFDELQLLGPYLLEVGPPKRSVFVE